MYGIVWNLTRAFELPHRQAHEFIPQHESLQALPKTYTSAPDILLYAIIFYYTKTSFMVHINPQISFVASACWSFSRKLSADAANALLLVESGWKHCWCNYRSCRLENERDCGHALRPSCFYPSSPTWKHSDSSLSPRRSVRIKKLHFFCGFIDAWIDWN